MGGRTRELSEAIARAIVERRRLELAWAAGADVRDRWEAVTARIAELQENRRKGAGVDNLTD